MKVVPDNIKPFQTVHKFYGFSFFRPVRKSYSQNAFISNTVLLLNDLIVTYEMSAPFCPFALHYASLKWKLLKCSAATFTTWWHSWVASFQIICDKKRNDLAVSVTALVSGYIFQNAERCLVIFWPGKINNTSDSNCFQSASGRQVVYYVAARVFARLGS